jgi:hypothetical protein
MQFEKEAVPPRARVRLVFPLPSYGSCCPLKIRSTCYKP